MPGKSNEIGGEYKKRSELAELMSASNFHTTNL